MRESFRILMITLAATALVAGPAFAGPGGPGKETGDPDIPNAPLKRVDLVTGDVADAPAGLFPAREGFRPVSSRHPVVRISF